MAALELSNIGREINEECEACERDLRSALTHAMNAGRLLAEAKAEVPHGRWLAWLGENVNAGARTVQSYMRLHEHRAEIEAGGDGLSIDGALRLIASPKPDEIRDLADYLESQGLSMRRDLFPAPGREYVGHAGDAGPIVIVSRCKTYPAAVTGEPQDQYVHVTILNPDESAVIFDRAQHWAMIATTIAGEGIDLDALTWQEREARYPDAIKNPYAAVLAA